MSKICDYFHCQLFNIFRIHSNRNLKVFLKCKLQAGSVTGCFFNTMFHYRSDNNWESQSKTTFIENQIRLCKTINSPTELKHWYSMLGFQLAHTATEKRVRMFLDDLLGPIFGLANNVEARSNHKILTINKHELLKDALQHFRNQTKWQRIYMEYTDQLNEFETGLNQMEM